MPSQQSTLLFQVATPGVSRRSLRAFVKVLAAEVAGGRDFCCLIAGDAELRRLNRDFRGRDYPTDVLSFSEGSQVGDLRHCLRHGLQHCLHNTLGEIAISYETATRQAAEYGHGVDQEIEILMLHGLLHLLGMDHETDRGRMSDAEQKWRYRLGLPAGLIERVGA